MPTVSHSYSSTLTKFPDTPEGWNQFKISLSLSRTPSTVASTNGVHVARIYASDYDDAQIKNTVSLFQKCHHHLARVGCFQGVVLPIPTLWRCTRTASLVEAWPAWSNNFNSPSLCAGGGAFRHAELEDQLNDHFGLTLSYSLCPSNSEAGTNLLIAFHRRILNLAVWALTATRRLTSPTPLKWSTFEEISKFRRPGFSPSEQEEPQHARRGTGDDQPTRSSSSFDSAIGPRDSL